MKSLLAVAALLLGAGVGAEAHSAKGAQALAAFLTTPDAIAAIRAKGMEPAR